MTYRENESSEIIEEFSRRLTSWENETKFYSDLDLIASGPDYEAILSMVREIPLHIAEVLQSRPSLLYLALEEVHGSFPTSDDMKGDIKAHCRAWSDWLKSRS